MFHKSSASLSPTKAGSPSMPKLWITMSRRQNDFSMATAVLSTLFCCVTSGLICSTLGLFCFVSSCSIHYSRSGSSQTGAGTDGNASSTGFCEGHVDGTADSHESAADEDTFALAIGVDGVDGWVCFVVDSRCGFITLKRCHPCAIRIGLWDVTGCSQ